MKKLTITSAIFLAATSMSYGATITWTANAAMTGDTSEIITDSGNGLTVSNFDEFTRDLYTCTTTGSDLATSAGTFTAADYGTALDYAENMRGDADKALTLSGLTVGQSYTVQFFSADLRSSALADRRLELTGSNAVVFSDNAGYITGTFIADSTSEEFLFKGTTSSDPTAINNQVLNMYAIDASGITFEFDLVSERVPEPSSTALLGLGAVSFMLRRKR